MKQQPEIKTTRMGVLLALLAGVIAAMIFVRQCSHESSTFRPVMARAGGDTVNVAIELNPACYMVRGDSAFGRDYEILMDISDKRGLPVKLHPFVPLKYALDGLDAGVFDMVVASMPMTAEMRQRYLMTEPVYLDREVLVQRRDSLSRRGAISSPIQLGGDTVWIAANSPIETRIRNLSHEIGDTIYVQTDPAYTAEHLVMLTALGSIPRAVVNRSVAQAMAADYPELDISTDISFTHFQAWVVSPRRQELLDSLNAYLRAR